MGSHGTETVDFPPDLSPAQLEVISFQRLQDGSPVEAAKLFTACKSSGFFYLDFKGIRAKIEGTVDSLFKVNEELFNLPHEELIQYDVDNLHKYKLNG